MSHELAVKVLRLGKPHFNQRNSFESPGIYQDSLALPRTIGPCFSGEQFNCLLAVVAKTAVTGHAHIELQDTVHDPVVLFDGQLELDPDQPWTHQLQHELTEPGPRVLQVQIKYKNEQVKTLTKSFSFEVSPAITARTRLLPIDASSGLAGKFSHALEVHVENVTESMITLDPQVIVQGAGFQMEPLGSPALKPRDVFSLGFLANCVAPDASMTLLWAREPLGVKGRIKIPLKKPS